MTAFKQVKNGAKSTLDGAINDSTDTITLQSGHGSRFPDSTYGEYWATIWDKAIYPDPRDDPNAEIVQVTARTDDEITATRGALTTNAVAHDDGSAFEMLLLDEHFNEVYSAIQTAEGNIETLQTDMSTKASVDDLAGKSDTGHMHTESDISDLGDYVTDAELTSGLAGKADISHTHDVADIDATGTADATTYLRGDGSWATPASSGGGEWTLLHDEDISGNTDFESFAVDSYERYRLRLLVPFNTANATTAATLRFNGDDGSNYSSHRRVSSDQDSTLPMSNQVNTQYLRIYSINGNGHYEDVIILNPATGFRTVYGKSTSTFGGASAYVAGGDNWGVWKSTSGITSIAITPSTTAAAANAFPTGTRLVIEGSNN